MSQTGYYQTAIQSLPLSIGLDNKTMVLLDTLRKQRNTSDCDGDPVSPAAVEEGIEQAAKLLEDLKAWLKKNRPDLHWARWKN